jgi:hypothetical protein
LQPGRNESMRQQKLISWTTNGRWRDSDRKLPVPLFDEV